MFNLKRIISYRTCLTWLTNFFGYIIINKKCAVVIRWKTQSKQIFLTWYVYLVSIFDSLFFMGYCSLCWLWYPDIKLLFIKFINTVFCYSIKYLYLRTRILNIWSIFWSVMNNRVVYYIITSVSIHLEWYTWVGF